MKTQLTKEQSQHLIDLGVPKEKASRILCEQLTDSEGNTIDEEYKSNFKWFIEANKPYKPSKILGDNSAYELFDIFTLTDLLEILPKEIKREYVICPLVITYGCDMPEADHDIWFAYYDALNDLEPKHSKELIDALYELACWTIENGYLIKLKQDLK